MNILFFTFWYPTKENPLKGLFIKEHAQAIHQSGNSIVVFSLNVVEGTKLLEKKIEVFTDNEGIETHIFYIESRFYKWIYITNFYLYYLAEKYFRKKIYPSFKPDIIHSNILNPCAIVGDWISSKYKTPHVITEHWSKVDHFMNRNILAGYGKKAYNNAVSITVVSKFLSKNISKYLKNPNKIVVIPNAIDTNLFNYSSKTETDTLNFTAIATWGYPKAPMYFINALQKVQKSGSKKIILNLIGEGPQLEEIRNTEVNYQINYLGNVSKSKIAEILARSDFFVHASYIETFSVVVAEALATGTPVVASNVGALPELINENNGILCNNTDEEWEEAIKNILQKNTDRIQSSKTIAKKYSKEHIGELFNQVYLNTVDLKV